MGRIVLHLAASIDGYIAEPDGGVRFLDTFDPTKGEDYGLGAFFRGVDACILGAKTFRDSRKLGPWLFSKMKTYIVSHRRIRGAPPGTEFFKGDVARLAKQVRARHRRTIWLMGGGVLASEFLRRRLVDEWVVTVVPVLVGRGIPLYHPIRGPPRMRLIKARAWKNGVVQLRYRVVRERD